MRLDQGRLPIAHRNVFKQVQAAKSALVMALQSALFGPTDPFVQELQKETEALDESEKRVVLLKADLREALSVRAAQEHRFKQAVLAFVGHVNGKAKGNATVIVSAGLELLRQPSPSPPMVAPQLGSAAPGLLIGEVKLRWPRVPGASSYQIERAPSPGGAYVLIVSSTTCTVKLLGQPTNVALYYRVRAIGPSGEGPYSDIVGTLLPDRGALLSGAGG